MSGFRRKENAGVKATRAPVDITTASGLHVPKGYWLVVEDGDEFSLSDEEFRREFESNKPAGTQLVPHAGPQRLAPGRVPQQSFIAPVGQGQGLARLADGLEGMVRGAMSQNVMLPGVEVIDDATGRVLAKRPALNVDTGRKPTIKSFQVDAAGNVTGATVEPEEFPPRSERF